MQAQVESYRPSPQQKRSWQLQQIEQSHAYGSQCMVALEGALSEIYLKEAVYNLVDRFEILRTSLELTPGLRWPVQSVSGTPSLSWNQVELRGLGRQEQEERLATLYREARGAVGDETQPRFLLAVLAPDKHVLLITLPAHCADRRSLENFVRELAECYAGCLHDRNSANDPMQYVQFAEWQNELLEGEDAEAGAEFWRKEYSRNIPALSPLVESKTATAAVYETQSINLAVDDEVVVHVNEVAARLNVTPELFLLACWQGLLWRLTGQPEITVAHVFDGRKYEELQDALGLFARNLPVRARFDENTRLSDVLRQASESISELNEWQEYFDFEAAEVEGTALPGFLSVSFEFAEESRPYSSAGVTFSISQQDICFEPSNLQLTCIAGQNSLITKFTYDTRRYEVGAVERLARQYHRLLAGAATQPDSVVARLDMLTDADKEHLLFALNNTAREYRRDVCLHELFEEQAARTPDARALTCEDRMLTFSQLNQKANRLAQYLQKQGVGPEAMVGLMIERSPEMVIGLLGILKAGGAYVPLDPSYPPDRLSFMLKDSEADVLLTQQHLAKTLPSCAAQVVLINSECFDSESTENPISGARPENVAYVIYTSGSTGTPKGVMVTHRGVVNYLSWAVTTYAVADGSGAPVHSPVGFDLTVTSLLCPLVAGRGVKLIPEDEGLEGLSKALLAGREFSLVKITPSHLEVLKQWLPEDKLAARANALIIGGEALFAEGLSDWRTHAPETRLINEYGPTETVVGCCTYEVRCESTRAGAVPIGRPIANTQLYLLDQYWQPVPFGATGELYIGGDGVSRGYLNRPDLTAEKFIPHPFSPEPGARLYRTGDLARYLPDGNLEFLGRNDAQVKVRGFRIELGEIEASLSQHPEVREAVVVAREDGTGDARLVAYVVAQKADVTGHEVRAHLKDRLPEYMVPSVFVMLNKLPLTANGKVDRRALPAPGSTRPDGEETYVAPRTEIQEVLAAIWSQVLGIEQISIHDNFFDLGGDSIRSVRMVALAKNRGLNFTVQQVFHSQTIAELEREFILHGGQSVPMVHTAAFDLISEADREKLPAGIEDAYPLAMMQQAMLYHLELTPGSPAYHNVCSWHVRAPFNEELLRAAVKELVTRHAVLRTSFDLTSYSRPLQLVHKEAEIPLHVFDLRQLSPEEQVNFLDEFLESERQNLFDLSRPSLMRYSVHRRSDETFSFTLTENHAIIDGWSTTSTLAELFEIYIGLVNDGIMPRPEPLGITYRDFIKLELQALASEESRLYWLQALTDATPVRVPRWPRSVPMATSKRIDKRVLPIDRDVYEGLKLVARTLAVPLKTVVFAAHLKVMSMISGQDDMLTGITLNGRPEETDGTRVRGLFLNTIPFRFKLFGGTWSELIRAVFEAEWNVLPHRRFPLGALQKHWGRDTLVETNFNFLHFHSLQEILRTGQIEVLGEGALDLSETNFTLQTTFEIKSTSLEDIAWVDLEFDSTQTCVEQREALIGYYDRVLKAIAADPHTRHDLQSFLSDEERAQIGKWGDGGKLTDADLLPTLFAAQAERTPDAVAVVFVDQQLSYRELDQRANQLASYLRSRGIGLEVAVGVLMERSLDLLVSLLGVLKAGAAYVPLDPSEPRERLAFILEDAAVPLLLTQQHLAESLQPISADVVCVDRVWKEISRYSTEHRESGVLADNLVSVIYTSGSTGNPKGTLITHRGLVNCLHSSVRRYEVELGEGVPLHSWISLNLTVTELFAPLLAGRKVVLLREAAGVEVPANQTLSGSVPIGRPIANTRLYALDRFLQPVPVEVPGELYIDGAGLARGYLKRPDLTAEKFIPHLFSENKGERLYRTGDLVRYRPDGNLEFLGRVDDLIKVDRRALPARGKSRPQKQTTFTGPQSDIELMIADVWREVLQVEQVGIHDNFFDLGGDSFSVYEAHHKLREKLECPTSILDLFNYPTIDALAKHLSHGNGVESSLQQSHERAQQRAMAAGRRQQLAAAARADLSE